MKAVAIILAAGRGTRMKSRLAKVLHPLAGVPMLSHVINLVHSLHLEKSFLIVGRQAEAVSALAKTKGVIPLLQYPLLGTGDAVRKAEKALKNFQGPVLILNGDTPLLREKSIRDFYAYYQRENATVGLLTVRLENPKGYGRVLRQKSGEIARIVEEKDATQEERRINEVNAGVYLCDAAFLFEALSQVRSDNKQKEYYLTDIIGIAVSQGKHLVGLEAAREEVIGINSRANLADAEEVMRTRINRHWMDEGVTMIDPSQVRIGAAVAIGMDSVIHPGVCLEGETIIGSGVQIYAGRIRESKIGNDVIIKDHCVIENAEIESGAAIGPFAHLRPGSVVRKGAKVGNFVEMKKTELGEGSKASHLSYLGDATIGKGVNIGAGTITCNYDGLKKDQTIIEDGVFIGSDTQLVAPVTVGAGALIAAGTTVTKDVPPDALAVSRTKQENHLEWAKKRRLRQKGV